MRTCCESHFVMQLASLSRSALSRAATCCLVVVMAIQRDGLIEWTGLVDRVGNVTRVRISRASRHAEIYV